MKKLENKTVLIAGGLSEVAKACALAAIREGANIIIADEESYETEMALKEIKKEDPNTIFIPCDVSQFDEVQAAVKRITKQFGGIDIALNNAGIDCEINADGNMSKEAWLKIMGINLNGLFNCMSHELPEMAKRKKGVVLNLASVYGSIKSTDSSHYVAVKHGIIGLTKTAAIEYASHGIRINALCPGSISVPIVHKMEAAIFKPGSRQQHTMNITAIKRMEKVKEIANGFVFMASERNPFISGTAVEIDGGYLSQ